MITVETPAVATRTGSPVSSGQPIRCTKFLGFYPASLFGQEPTIPDTQAVRKLWSLTKQRLGVKTQKLLYKTTATKAFNRTTCTLLHEVYLSALYIFTIKDKLF